jgi:hypothetical protein
MDDHLQQLAETLERGAPYQNWTQALVPAGTVIQLLEICSAMFRAEGLMDNAARLDAVRRGFLVSRVNRKLQQEDNAAMGVQPAVQGRPPKARRQVPGFGRVTR